MVFNFTTRTLYEVKYHLSVINISILTVNAQAKKKNKCVYGPPTDPYFWPDPKHIYGTFSRKLFKCPIFAFQCSF